MGEKFNAPDPGATQPTTEDEAGQRGGFMKVKFDRAAGVGSTSDDPGAGPDAASRNFYKWRNDNPQADDAKQWLPANFKMKLENAKSVDSFLKLENAKSDPGPGPDAASSPGPSGGYDVKKQDRI